MSTNCTVTVRPYEGQSEYDCLISAIGFESRARFFAESRPKIGRRQCAIAFADRRVLAYEENLNWYRRAGFEVYESPESDYEDIVNEILSSTGSVGDVLSLCIDISSLSRRRIATVLSLCRAQSTRRPISVDLVYCAAEFSDPASSMPPNEEIGPVLNAYAGWSNEDYPTAAIVGLGYEYDRAVGAVEFLDPTEVWLFKPTGHDPRYTKEISRANRGFLDSSRPQRIVLYDVFRPMDSFIVLESLVSGLLRSRRVVILPFGPKIFAAAALILATADSQVAVWRVSPGANEPAGDRRPNGKIVGLSMTLDNRSLVASGRPVDDA